MQGSIYFFVEGNGYDVYIKEVRREINIWNPSEFRKPHVNLVSIFTSGDVWSLLLDKEAEDNVGVVGDEVQGSSQGAYLINDHNHNHLSKVVADKMLSVNALEKEANDEHIMDEKTIGENKLHIGNNESKRSDRTRTIGLDDDRRTEEVLMDLGLSQNGQMGQTIVNRAYKVWMADEINTNDGGPNVLELSLPPSFGPTKRRVCTSIPNTMQDIGSDEDTNHN